MCARQMVWPRLRDQTPIGGVMLHPAFRGLGPLLLPHQSDAERAELELGRVALLLPGRTAVNSWAVEAGLNALSDDACQGLSIFYPLDEVLEGANGIAPDTPGVFVLRGQPGAPFALIFPGGGFDWWAGLHEGFPLGREIRKMGYTACIVRYRVGLGAAAAAQDAARALGLVLDLADELQTVRRGFSFWGCGAGGRLAGCLGTYGAQRYGGPDAPKPAAVITAYCGYGAASAKEPPWYGVAGADDRVVQPAVMHARAGMLGTYFVPAKVVVARAVGHGFGLGIDTPAEGWPSRAAAFWEHYM